MCQINNKSSRNQDVDFDMLELLFSFQCAKFAWREQMAEYKTFQKKRRNSPKKTIRPFCTIVTHSVLLCYTAIGHFRWDPKWPWAAWQWVVMTFQAFRGLNSVHDLISQQCQQFIALCYLHLWWYFMIFFSKALIFGLSHYGFLALCQRPRPTERACDQQ